MVDFVVEVEEVVVEIQDEADDPALIEVPEQGPPGPASGVCCAVVGEPIEAFKIIRSDPTGQVFLADYETDVGEILGVTLTGAPTVSGTVTFSEIGRIPFAGATPGDRYYLGSTGNFTNVPPVKGLFRQMAACFEAGALTLTPNPTIRRHEWP